METASILTKNALKYLSTRNLQLNAGWFLVLSQSGIVSNYDHIQIISTMPN